MAKRARREPAMLSERPAGAQALAIAEDKIEEFAEDLGRLLGTARARAEGWLGQRKTIAAQLAQIRDTAQSLIAELTGGPAASGQSRRASGRKGSQASAAKAPRMKRKLSAAARERIAAAQRARWAKYRKAKA